MLQAVSVPHRVRAGVGAKHADLVAIGVAMLLLGRGREQTDNDKLQLNDSLREALKIMKNDRRRANHCAPY